MSGSRILIPRTHRQTILGILATYNLLNILYMLLNNNENKMKSNIYRNEEDSGALRGAGGHGGVLAAGAGVNKEACSGNSQ